MSDPIVDSSDLQLFMGLPTIDADRADMLLADAQALCETVLSPLPAAAAGIIRRMAARAYSNVSSAHSVSLGNAAVSYGAPGGSIGVGGMYLSRSDKADLRRLGGGGGAFSVNLLAGYVGPALPPWDSNGNDIISTS